MLNPAVRTLLSHYLFSPRSVRCRASRVPQPSLARQLVSLTGTSLIFLAPEQRAFCRTINVSPVASTTQHNQSLAQCAEENAIRLI